MFDKEEAKDLKVLVIGNDDVLRSGWCKKTDKLAFERYEIDPEAIFLTEEYKFFGLLKVSNVPTIEFFENSTKPVIRPEKSLHKPDEIGDAVSMAAWALAKLLISKNEKFETMITWLLVAACVLGAIGAGLGYINYQNINKNCSGGGGGGGTIDNSGVITPAPTPTIVPVTVVQPTPPPTVAPVVTSLQPGMIL